MNAIFNMRFRGVYGFLSNFYNCCIEYEGKVYSSVENAFQASKTLSGDEREEVRVLIMTELIFIKFNNAFNSAELTGDDLVSVRNIAEVFSDPNNLVILDSSIKHYKLQDVIRTFAGNVSTMIKLGIHYSYDGGFTFVRM